MSGDFEVRTSLEVGFAEGEMPERFLRYRGKAMRSIPAMAEFPYEDSQFEVVVISGRIVSRELVKEAHRVLKPDGRMFFTVNEKTSKQEGYSMPDIYSIVREGFDIALVERPAWWFFGRKGRTITICARKKAWKEYKGFARGKALALSPFRSRS